MSYQVAEEERVKLEAEKLAHEKQVTVQNGRGLVVAVAFHPSRK